MLSDKSDTFLSEYNQSSVEYYKLQESLDKKSVLLDESNKGALLFEKILEDYKRELNPNDFTIYSSYISSLKRIS